MTKPLWLMYFSPTSGTLKAAKETAAMLGDVVFEQDMTQLAARHRFVEIPQDVLLLLALPVHGDRLPEVSGDIFAHLKTQGAAAAGLLVGEEKGARALRDFAYRLQTAGFCVLDVITIPAGETNVAETSAGSNVCSAAERIIAELQNAEYVLPVGNPGVLENYMPGPPVTTSEKCNLCGLCVPGCPVAAIDPHTPSRTDHMRCIRCGACVVGCPQMARSL